MLILLQNYVFARTNGVKVKCNSLREPMDIMKTMTSHPDNEFKVCLARLSVTKKEDTRLMQGLPDGGAEEGPPVTCRDKEDYSGYRR